MTYFTARRSTFEDSLDSEKQKQTAENREKNPFFMQNIIVIVTKHCFVCRLYTVDHKLYTFHFMLHN